MEIISVCYWHIASTARENITYSRSFTHLPSLTQVSEVGHSHSFIVYVESLSARTWGLSVEARRDHHNSESSQALAADCGWDVLMLVALRGVALIDTDSVDSTVAINQELLLHNIELLIITTI